MPTYDIISKSAIAQLRDCLKLQNNIACLNIIIDNILQVGRRHLDSVPLPSHRKKALLAIGEELKELYPDIFAEEDGEKRVYIAVQIAMRQHSLKCKEEKKTGKFPLQEKERTLASKSVSKKPNIPNQGSDANQVPVDATKHATDKPLDKRKAKTISNIQQLVSATIKASDSNSINIIPPIRRSPLVQMQDSNEENEDQAMTEQVFYRKKTTTIPNIRRSPFPMDVITDATDIISEKAKNIPDLQRSRPFPLVQDENQASQNLTTHGANKASAKMKAKKILDTRCSSSISTCERGEDQAVTMHAMDKISGRRKAEKPLSERALRLASIGNAPSAIFTSPSIRGRASDPSESVSSQPRRRAPFVPHVSESQPHLNNISQPWSSIGDACSEYSSISILPHPTTSADASSSLSTSKGSPSRRFEASQSKPVHHFLEACVPSMSYLLPCFNGYGCTDEGFLLAVSMWPPERIRKFLEDVLTGPDGQLISPMEQMVLENHFTQYFK